MSKEYYKIREKQREVDEERAGERHAKGRWDQRSLFDMAGDFLTDKVASGIEEIGNNMEYNKIFNDEVKKELKNEIWYICLAIVDDFTFALYSETKQDARNPISWDNRLRGMKIFDKLERKLINAEKYKEVALQVFENHPMCDKLLPWCVEHFYDEDGNFQLIAHWLKKEADVVQVKEKMFKQVYNIDNEKAALRSREEFDKLSKKLAYMPAESSKNIDNAITKFDREARTVEGVEYKTREEAKGIANAIADALKKYEEILKSKSPQKVEDYPVFEQAVIAAGIVEYAPIISRLATLKSRLETQHATLKSRLEKQHVAQTELSQKFGITMDQSRKILSMGEKIKFAKIEAMTVYEQNDPLIQQVKQDFSISEDDFVFAKINFYKNKGIVLTANGIYFNLPQNILEMLKFDILEFIAKSPAKIALIVVLLLPLSFALPFALSLVLLILLIKILCSRAIQHNKTLLPFIPWLEINPSNSSDDNLLGINQSSTLYLPGKIKKSKITLLKLMTDLAKIVKE